MQANFTKCGSVADCKMLLFDDGRIYFIQNDCIFEESDPPKIVMESEIERDISEEWEP